MAANAETPFEYLSLAQQALQFQSASDVLQVLYERDVPVLALKGLALLKRIYSDSRDRLMGDIDLLIGVVIWLQWKLFCSLLDMCFLMKDGDLAVLLRMSLPGKFLIAKVQWL